MLFFFLSLPLSLYLPNIKEGKKIYLTFFCPLLVFSVQSHGCTAHSPFTPLACSSHLPQPRRSLLQKSRISVWGNAIQKKMMTAAAAHGQAMVLAAEWRWHGNMGASAWSRSLLALLLRDTGAQRPAPPSSIRSSSCSPSHHRGAHSRYSVCSPW